MKKIRSNVRWAAYFARFNPAWKSTCRICKRLAMQEFLARDERGCCDPMSKLAEWIMAGKQWFTSLRNDLRRRWLTDEWQGYMCDFDQMPRWLFDGWYSWLPFKVSRDGAIIRGGGPGALNDSPTGE